MAAIAKKLASGLTNKSGRFLTATVVNIKVPSANIYGKTMAGELEERPPPWNWKRYGFNYWHMLIDGTTKRFNDNTKIIVVDGPPAIEKSKFAKDLAEELGMMYFPAACMDDGYINKYGYDARNLDADIQFERNLSFDEKKFSQDPTAQDGALDRMLMELYELKFLKYVFALRHLFNTGQGIVMEKSPYNNYCYVEAAYRQGWIDKETRKYFYIVQGISLEELMKPHLIIYLDAPTSVVQGNLAKRGETGPVYSNTEYMNHWADLNKKDYLKEASIGSEVLVYDWSEGGDAEVVVEDIEALNLDYYDKYSKKHEDWRLHTEDAYWIARRKYTMYTSQMVTMLRYPYFNATKVWKTPAENMEWQQLYTRVPGNKFLPGYNEAEGDPNPLFAFGGWREAQFSDGPWFKDSSIVGSSLDFEHEDRVRASRRAAGLKNWWYGAKEAAH